MQPNEPMLGAAPTATQASTCPEVLHYLGYDEDYGGIVSVIRALAAAGLPASLGMNEGCRQHQRPPLPLVEFPALRAESFTAATLVRSRAVARAAAGWLRGGPERVFHAHSRAGLLVALWLHRWGARRVFASVHCLGRRRWFYRAAARRIGQRLYWLSPAMKAHYAVGDASWRQCLPDCVPAPARRPMRLPRGDGCVFGAVGRYMPDKQWERLVLGLAGMSPAARRRARIVHAGGAIATPANAAYAAQLRRLAEAHGVAGQIEWRGHVAPLDEFWRGIDCLLVVSPHEAFSVSALEAVTAGVPIVATDAAGTRDLISAARAGWTYAESDPTALATRMTALTIGSELAAWEPDWESLAQFHAPAVARQYLTAYGRAPAT